jgi:hypothetical protein
MKIAFYCAGATGAILTAFLWLMTQIEYRIGRTHLKVVLFGVPLRRIVLKEITSVSKREPRRMAENWCNTLKKSHRLITIQRSRGLRKYICITPRNRYVFLADLKNAVRRANPDSDWARREMEEANSPEQDSAEETSA